MEHFTTKLKASYLVIQTLLLSIKDGQGFFLLTVKLEEVDALEDEADALEDIEDNLEDVEDALQTLHPRHLCLPSTSTCLPSTWRNGFDLIDEIRGI